MIITSPSDKAITRSRGAAEAVCPWDNLDPFNSGVCDAQITGRRSVVGGNIWPHYGYLIRPSGD